MTQATRALKSHDLLEEEINCGSHTYKDMEGLPTWGISSMPEPLPRQYEHERRYTPLKHTFILTRWIWKDDYNGQMIFVDVVGLKRPDICLIGEEKPRKNLTQETFPDRGSNLVPLRDRRARYCLLRSGVPFHIHLNEINIYNIKRCKPPLNTL